MNVQLYFQQLFEGAMYWNIVIILILISVVILRFTIMNFEIIINIPRILLKAYSTNMEVVLITVLILLGLYIAYITIYNRELVKDKQRLPCPNK
jgi:hypothetical protein